MTRIVISGDLKEEDILLIGKFFREFWRNRPENIMLMIEEGTEQMSKEECAKFIARIFKDDDSYDEIPIGEAIASIEEKFKKKRVDDKRIVPKGKDWLKLVDEINKDKEKKKNDK